MRNDLEIERVKSLKLWSGIPTVRALEGGITNRNYRVTDQSGSYVVRLGDDIPVHQIVRSNELAASRAAQAAGVAPAVVHSEPGVLVLDFVESRAFTPDDVCQQGNLVRIVDMIRRCHHLVPQHLRGASLIFWVFHVVRDYAATLRDGNSSHVAQIDDLLAAAAKLEHAAGPFDIVFGHNDLLPANILDDGDRLWLVDWEYAGFNTPLFDLGGLASNNGLTEPQERWLLEAYFEQPPSDALWYRYQAMKCASLLRETMWSMVSEIHSTLDFDYVAYTVENRARFDAAFTAFRQA